MLDYLFMPIPLSLETVPVAPAKMPGGIDDFGETTVYGEAGYDDAAFRSLFFGRDNLQGQGIYALAGRYAIQSLDEQRTRMISGLRWPRMTIL